MTQRVVHRLEAQPSDGDSLVRALRVLEELLPLDEDRRAEASVWLEAIVRARFDERLAALKTAGWFGSRYLCRLAWAHLHDLDRPNSPHSHSGAPRTDVQQPNCTPSSTG